MISVPLILMIIALVFFILGAANTPGRVNWTPLGLAFWLLAVMIR